MNVVYLVLLSLYALQTVWANWHREQSQLSSRGSRSSVLLQTPLFFMAVYLAATHEAFDRTLVSPLHLLIGLGAGHIIFTLSLLVTHQQARDVAEHMFNLKALWRFVVENPPILFRFIGVSVTEEIVYRAAAQPVLIDLTENPWVSIVLAAILFSIVHWHFFRNPPLQSLEFITFALLLGTLYYFTHSLGLVIIIHALRNLEIVYLEYLIKIDELGGEEQAQEALEREYSPRAAGRP